MNTCGNCSHPITPRMVVYQWEYDTGKRTLVHATCWQALHRKWHGCTAGCPFTKAE